MSAITGSALPPAWLIAFAVFSTIARSPRPLTTTAAPCSASVSAMHLPMFLPEPVTIATLPARGSCSAMTLFSAAI